MHMVPARLGCQNTTVGTRWAISCPGCMDKCYSHLVGGSFLAWTLSGCLTTDSGGADYCMLVNEWVWLKSRVCLLRLEVDLGSVFESELGHKWDMLR